MRVQRNGASPLFYQLYQRLKQEIEEGNYNPGDLLPSESSLIDQYSVSRTTVRKAVQKLAHEGFVYTVHGKGTYVSDAIITQDLPGLTSFSHDVDRKGMKPGRQVLQLETLVSSKDIASRLQISPSEQVLYVNRLLLADDEPVSLGFTYLPVSAIAPYQDQFTVEILEEKSLYTLMLEIGISLAGGEQLISATVADDEVAQLLNVSPGSALLSGERIALDDEKNPVEFTRILSRPEWQRWRIHLSPPDFID